MLSSKTPTAIANEVRRIHDNRGIRFILVFLLKYLCIHIRKPRKVCHLQADLGRKWPMCAIDWGKLMCGQARKSWPSKSLPFIKNCESST